MAGKGRNIEYDVFDAAMDKLLKANPETVKAAMEQEKRERAKDRKAKRANTSIPKKHARRSDGMA